MSTSSTPFSIRDLLWRNPFRRQSQPQQGVKRSNGTEGEDVDDERKKGESKCNDYNWVIMSNGSYQGYFDWVPIHLRVGKWSTAATMYFRFLWIVTLLLLWNDLSTGSSESNNRSIDGNDELHNTSDGSRTCSLAMNGNNDNIDARYLDAQNCDPALVQVSSTFRVYLQSFIKRYWVRNYDTILHLTPVLFRSYAWYYHTVVSMYMIFLCYIIIAHSPLSLGAWITYTVQSWTLLMIRHILYSLSGLFDFVPSSTDLTGSNNLVVLAELIRFPCAVAHTITFVVWNFILVPYIAYVTFRNDIVKRQNFITFCTSFRLINLHGMNIIFCVCNVWYFNSNTVTTTTASSSTTTTVSSRTFEMADLYVSGISALLYWTFYLCILDRAGVHLYPLFSPRHSNLLVCTIWTTVIVLYIVTFYTWQVIIQIHP
jgi:hypothetical protein